MLPCCSYQILPVCIQAHNLTTVWQVQFLPLADKVVVMADGRIEAVGSFAVPLSFSRTFSLAHSLLHTRLLSPARLHSMVRAQLVLVLCRLLLSLLIRDQVFGLRV